MKERKPTLCIVAGPNGSGKTTTTVQLLNNEWAADSIYINPDNMAQDIFGDWNSPEAVLKAAEEAPAYDMIVWKTVVISSSRLFFLHPRSWNSYAKLRMLVISFVCFTSVRLTQPLM